MRTKAKTFLLPAVLLLILSALSILMLNLYLRMESTRNIICKTFSGMLDSPVSVRNIQGIPFVGIRITGVNSVRNGRPFFSAESVSVRPDYLALFHGNLVMKGLTLVNPAVHLSLGSPAVTSTQVVMQVPSPPTSSPAPSVPQPTPAAGPSEFPSPPTVPENGVTPQQTLHDFPMASIGIDRGAFFIEDQQGNPILKISGIDLKGKEASTGEWKGQLRASLAVIASRFIIRDLKTTVSFTRGTTTLAMNPLTATFGGGKIQGGAVIVANPGLPRYSINLNLADASLKKLLADASMGSSSAEGKITGGLELSGIAGQGSSMQGKGSLLCSDATIQPVDFLKQIGHLLNIEELQLLRITEGKCLFQVESGHVAIDDLSLRSENLILTAKGPVKPSGDLDLDSRLLFNEKLSGKLRGILGRQLTPAPESGYSQIAFHVAGPATNPKTDLIERITGFKIGGDLGGLLQGLFGRPAPKSQSPPASVTPNP